MDTLLDAILRETRHRQSPGEPIDLRGLRAPWNEDVVAERRRLLLLADRSGPKGALAGLLDDLLRLS